MFGRETTSVTRKAVGLGVSRRMWFVDERMRVE
jgi:hypothetical protein